MSVRVDRFRTDDAAELDLIWSEVLTRLVACFTDNRAISTMTPQQDETKVALLPSPSNDAASDVDLDLDSELDADGKLDEYLTRPDPEPGEHACKIGFEIFIPYILSGFGTVVTGLLLDIVQVDSMFRINSHCFPSERLPRSCVRAATSSLMRK